MATAVVCAENLAKTYQDWRGRKTHALQGVSFKVAQGSIFGLLGRNGAGKTTLVKILLGLVPADSGTASILSSPVAVDSVRKRVGYLPEQIRLPDYLKGPDFLRYMGELNGVPSSTLKRRIPELMDQMGLGGPVAKQALKSYSKGMQQRLGLAQALLNDPELIFLDEPTEGLDPIGRKQIRDLLAEMRAKGKTIFLNSHLLSEVELLCDQIVIMEKGNVMRSGPPAMFTQKTGAYRITVAAVGEKVRAAMAANGTEWNGAAMTFTPRDRAHLNLVIDELRAQAVEIESVQPVRSTLEESFIEVVTEAK